MRRVFLVALALAILIPLLAVMLALVAISESEASCGGGPVGEPVGGVPASLVSLFQGAAAAYQLGPHGASILAAINSAESDFDESTLPGVHSGANYAGAEGPMQFLAGTWAAEAVSAPGDQPGQSPNVYDEADAVFSAAHYLHDMGMTPDPSTWAPAVFGYNHSLAYVQQVLNQASTFYSQGLAGNEGGGSSVPVSLTVPSNPKSVHDDPAGPLNLIPGQPVVIAAEVLEHHTGAWGDDLKLSNDSYAELSPGLPGTVTRQSADMLGDLPYLTPLEIANPANGRSVVLYKRDIAAGPALSRTLRGHHFRIALTPAADTRLGLAGAAIVRITLLSGSVSGPGAGQTCAAPITPGTYVNPFAHSSGLVPQRIDQGVDYDGAGPIDAIGEATITHISTAAALGWPGDYYITYELDDGPDQGSWIYVAEDLDPVPGLHVGEQVSAGQQIANFAVPQSDGIETGWAQPDASEPQPMAQIDGGYIEGQRTAAGTNFSGLLASTGAPPGLVEGRPVVGHYP